MPGFLTSKIGSPQVYRHLLILTTRAATILKLLVPNSLLVLREYESKVS